MADNNKPQSGNLTSNSLIIAALVATGTAFIYRDAPLQPSRPTLEETQLHQHIGAQDVDARLWQDPFAAIAQKTKNGGDEKAAPCAQPEKDKSHCEPPKFEKNDVALAVTVSGAPFYEDAEFRRRLRYAVLAGLARQGFRPDDSRHLGYYRPIRSQGAASELPTVIPFETFGNNQRRVVVLWVDEDVAGDRPLGKLSQLANELGLAPQQNPFRIIGPQSSETLKKMDADASTQIENARVYVYGATGAREGAKKGNIPIVRTIGADDKLAHAVADELHRRNITPGDDQHVALVSELDTLYGGSIIDTFENVFHPERAAPGQSKFVHRVGYLRGLDGALPPAKKGDGQSKGGEGRESSGGKESAKTQARALDLPYGQSQFDYLRRLADRLRDEDKALRDEGRSGIRAIGVLGSDVFDKLLVLRALKPAFPNAVFFTTDLDTTLTAASELDWTRNLIIASSLGRELKREWQGDIPPFRSAYQTSAFLATQLALAEFNPDAARELRDQNVDPEKQWLGEPLLFQIPRSGDIRRLPRRDVNLSTRQKPSCEEVVHPATAAPFPRIGSAKQQAFAVLLAAAGAFILWAAKRRSETQRRYDEPDHLSVDFMWIGALLMVGGAVSAFWEPIAGFLTNGGRGEEIAWAGGTSVWPSLAIGGLAILISLRLIWRICRELDLSLEKVAHELRLAPPREAMREAAREIEEKAKEKPLTFPERLGTIFGYRLQEGRSSENKSYDVGIAWRNYVYQGRASARLLRSGFWSVVATIVFWLIAHVSRFPAQPLRGDLARHAEWISFYLEFFVLSFLVMLVLDATLFCWSFANELARTRTYWPEATRKLYKSKLGAHIGPAGLVSSERREGSPHERPPEPPTEDWSEEILDDWIDLTFIEKHTACIGTFVYYPFLAIALVILAQSSVLTPYQSEPLAFVAQCLGLLVLFGCAMALRRVAEKARTGARRHLTAAIVRTKSGGAPHDRKGMRLEALRRVTKRAHVSAAIVRTGGVSRTLDWKPEQLRALLERVDDLHQGAFSPLSQQPFIRALLIPLTSVGWAALVDLRLIPGF